MQHKAEKRHWYKQFWPWFLIAFPLSSMVLSFTMMKLAFTGKDSLVIDDYYKEGRSINLDLHKFQEAKVRDIEAQLLFGSNTIELVFIKGNLDDGSRFFSFNTGVQRLQNGVVQRCVWKIYRFFRSRPSRKMAYKFAPTR